MQEMLYFLFFYGRIFKMIQYTLIFVYNILFENEWKIVKILLKMGIENEKSLC